MLDNFTMTNHIRNRKTHKWLPSLFSLICIQSYRDSLLKAASGCDGAVIVQIDKIEVSNFPSVCLCSLSFGLPQALSLSADIFSHDKLQSLKEKRLLCIVSAIYLLLFWKFIRNYPNLSTYSWHLANVWEAAESESGFLVIRASAVWWKANNRLSNVTQIQCLPAYNSSTSGCRLVKSLIPVCQFTTWFTLSLLLACVQDTRSLLEVVIHVSIIIVFLPQFAAF